MTKILNEELKVLFPKINGKRINEIEIMVEIFEEYLQGFLSVEEVLEKSHNLKERTFFRKMARYKQDGVKGLVHKSTGRIRGSILSAYEEKKIFDLYSGNLAKEKNDPTLNFSEYSFSYFHVHLLKRKITNVSYSTLRKFLLDCGFVSPNMKNCVQAKVKIAANRNIEFQIGERVEIDATEFYWMIDGEMRKMYIHVAFDRGLGAPVAMFVADSETTVAYFELMYRVNSNFGIPRAIYTDKRGSFVSLRDQEGSITKFAECFLSFGCEIESSSNSNFKPGVENYNRTLKSHIALDLKREGINTMVGLQAFLEEHVFDEIKSAMHKAKRSKKYVKKHNVFMKKKNKYIINNRFVANRDTRSINKNVFKINNEQYSVLFADKLRSVPNKTEVQIITNFRGETKYRIGNENVTLVAANKTKDVQSVEEKVKLRKMPATNCINICGKTYVPVFNNGKLVKIDHMADVQVYDPTKYEHNLLKYNGNTYKLMPLDEFEDKEYIKDDKEAIISYRHTISVFNKIFVVVDGCGNHLELVAKTKVIATTKRMKYESIIDGNYYNLIELKDYHKKNELPTKFTSSNNL